MDRFKHFLINEGRTYLGRRVNDVLTSLQDVQEDMPNLGARHLNKLADQIVNQIRKILHDSWDAANHKHLKSLQKIAVAIQKTIDEKGDLREILPAATQSVQAIAGKLGVKVNDLQGPEMGGEDVGPEDFDLTGTGPSQQSQQQQGQPGQLPGQLPGGQTGGTPPSQPPQPNPSPISSPNQPMI